jgi:hypothetical protein
MTLAEASRTTDPFKDPEEFKKQVALSVDQDKEAKKLAMIARVVSRVPEAEKSAIAEELFENVFPSQNS